jgi:hypothetical protein
VKNGNVVEAKKDLDLVEVNLKEKERGNIMTKSIEISERLHQSRDSNFSIDRKNKMKKLDNSRVNATSSGFYQNKKPNPRTVSHKHNASIHDPPLETNPWHDYVINKRYHSFCISLIYKQL